MLATNINKNLLLKVMKVADVFEFTIAKTGDRPVDMVSVDGKKYKLTISELTDNFTTLQGKPIRIIRLNKNKQYVATKLQSTPCFAVKVPRGSNKHIDMPNGQVVGPGKVIVVHADKLVINGDYVDMSAGTIMTEAFFRKTCVLKEISEIFRQRLITGGIIVDDGQVSTTPTVEPVTTVNTEKPATQITEQPTEQPVTHTEVQATSKAKIVSIIKQYGTDNVLFYNVYSNGEYVRLSVANTITACEEGLISNAAAVTNSKTGSKFLRGVGISLEDLPVDYV